MGIVGNEGSRKEVVIVGETVERAFLYMQTASKHYGKIYVDHETRMEASLFLDFKYLEHVEFAHKLTNYPVFEPIDFYHEWFDTKYSGKGKYFKINVFSCGLHEGAQNSCESSLVRLLKLFPE